jgi:hypothetical protein
MHHEIAGVFLVVEVLQQEAGIAVMNVRKPSPDDAIVNPKSS